MRKPGSDGNLNVMFFKNVQIICLMVLLTKGEEGQTLIHCRNCLGDDFNDLVFLSFIILHGIYYKTWRTGFHIYLILPGSLMHCLLRPPTPPWQAILPSDQNCLKGPVILCCSIPYHMVLVMYSHWRQYAYARTVWVPFWPISVPEGRAFSSNVPLRVGF